MREPSPASSGETPAHRIEANPGSLAVRSLGRVDYAVTHARMLDFTLQRDGATNDEIWLLEHPPVFTLGQASRAHHVLASGDIAVVQTERGGQVTYHGPGQLIAYALIDLRRRGIKVREFVRILEQAVLDTLAAYNVDGARRAGAPGVYVEHRGVEHKIAALGIKVVNGCTFHGLALNVAMDLEPFERIDPCGYPGLRCIDLVGLGVHTSCAEIGPKLAALLARLLGAKEMD